MANDIWPFADVEGLSRADKLAIGSIGLVHVTGIGVVHTIGYGIGHEGLQILSGRGELGFAENYRVLEFYSRHFGGEAALFEAPLANGDE